MLKIDKNSELYTVVSFDDQLKKIDILVSDKIKKQLQQIIDENKPVIFDIDNVLYIDSSGIGTIISLYNYAKNSGCKFILCNVSKGNMELVKITKLTNVLNIQPNLISAIELAQF